MLLPAPFSPTSPQISPAATARSTPSSATVAPKRLRMPRISKRGAAPRSFEPLRQVRLQQSFISGLIHVVVRREVDAGVDRPLDLLALDVRHHRLHPQIAHLHRVLHDQAVERAVAQPLDQVRRGVEADELDLAGPPVLLQHAHHREGGRLVGAEHAVHAERSRRALQAGEERLRFLVGALDVGAGVLVRADHLDARVPGHRLEKPLLALAGAVVPSA